MRGEALDKRYDAVWWRGEVETVIGECFIEPAVGRYGRQNLRPGSQRSVLLAPEELAGSQLLPSDNDKVNFGEQNRHCIPPDDKRRHSFVRAQKHYTRNEDGVSHVSLPCAPAVIPSPESLNSCRRKRERLRFWALMASQRSVAKFVARIPASKERGARVPAVRHSPYLRIRDQGLESLDEASHLRLRFHPKNVRPVIVQVKTDVALFKISFLALFYGRRKFEQKIHPCIFV